MLRKFVRSSKSYKGNRWRAHRYEFTRPFPPTWFKRFINNCPSIDDDQSFIHKIMERFASGCLDCQFALTHWVWQCVHIAWANHTDSMASSCAQRVCMEAGNRRESRWTWGSIRGIISVDNAWFFSVTGFDSIQVGNNSGGTGFEHLYKVHLSLNIAWMRHVTPQAYFCLMKTQRGKHNHMIKKINKNLNCSLYKTLFKPLQLVFFYVTRSVHEVLTQNKC